MTTNLQLAPLLVVRGAARAVDFYVGALGARLLACYEHGPERRISHADFALGDSSFALTEEARGWNGDAPEPLAGSPVVLQLGVRDAARTLQALCDAGASVLFPLCEILGERMARVRDPFGHVWLLRQRIEELSIPEIQRRRDELFRLRARTRDDAAALEDGNSVRQPSTARQAAAAPLHLILGPVGAGKSTFAQALARQRGAVRFTLDEWMAVLFRPDRPETGLVEWYVERAARCVEQIWALAQPLSAAGTQLVLEIGLLARDARERFYERAAAANLPLQVYVLDAPRALRRARVEERNRVRGPTFSALIPPELFELASDLWEPVEASECEGRDVRFVDTGAQGSAL